MVEEVRGAFPRDAHTWNMHDTLFVEMCDELVTVRKDCIDVFLKFGFAHGQRCQESCLKGLTVRYQSSPMMLAIPFGKDLAPLEHCGIKEGAVCSYPELMLHPYLLPVPPSAKESNVSKAMTAKDTCSPCAFAMV